MPRVGSRSIMSGTRPVVVETHESCTDPSATLDLAALSEGSLSPEGMQRLAGHVVRCPACQVVLGVMVQDAHAVDFTQKRPCETNRLFESGLASGKTILDLGCDG